MFESIQPSLSVQEYLDLEKSSKERHEYIGGHLYAIAGASQRHSRITGNIFTALWALSNGLGCRIFQNGMRLRIGEATFYYPDVMAVCEQEEPDPYFEVNPCILIEVLSPSTKTVDLREKMLEYKRLPSLQTYLLSTQRVCSCGIFGVMKKVFGSKSMLREAAICHCPV